ncbi:MAG: large ribosomal subunit protein uL22 [Solitalea-like symbiont of Acarus siro]
MDNSSTNVSLKNCPVSALKVRTVVDLLRGESVAYALSALKYHSKKNISEYLSKLVKAGIASWKEKYTSANEIDIKCLYISEIAVNQGSYVKRMRAASRGRVHRIKRPYSHILLTIKNRSTAVEVNDSANTLVSVDNKKEK